MAAALTTQIKVVSEIIKTYDERIETLFDTLPDAGLFKSLPGSNVLLLHADYRSLEAMAITDAKVAAELITGACIHLREGTAVFVHLPVYAQI